MKTLSTRIVSFFPVFALLSIALGCAAEESRADIDNISALNQSQFKPLAHDLVAALSYKALTPAEPLGITGFDLGVGVSAIETSSGASWGVAEGSERNYLALPRLSIQKGLPFDVDVGGFFATAPGTGIQFFGGEVKYAVFDGGFAFPAVAVRAAATRLSGVEQLDLDTRSVELTLSKGLLNFTPYGGIGKVWGDVTPVNPAAPTALRLQKESPEMVRIFAGLNFNIFLGNFVVEVEKTGDNFGASTKIGIRF